MNFKARGAIVASLLVVAAGPLAAQRGMGGMGMMSMPHPQGIWNPVVGSGAVYELDHNGEKTQIQYAVVGKESVNGKDAYWVETVMSTPRGSVVSKSLTVLDRQDTHVERLIVQPPGQQPMEMPMRMMEMRHPTTRPADIRQGAKDLGKESVTTPAGTFSCEHYQTSDGQTDSWVSTDVPPYGLVKSATKGESTLVLVSVLKDAKDQITGTPRPFNPMGMMGGAPPQ